MDEWTRTELDKLHARVSDLKERVVTLETHHPHINKSLARIEDMVQRLNGHIVKAVWLMVAALLIAMVNFALRGGFHIPA